MTPNFSSQDGKPIRIRFGLAAAVLLLVAVVVFFLLPASRSSAVVQPIQFNHEIHTAQEPCETCHRFVAVREVAGRPDMGMCMECHTNPVTKSDEEAKLREMAKQNQVLAWVRLTRMPPHVRFSHQRHVAVGKVPCKTCHGDIGERTVPPSRALVSISMNFCIGCHQRRAVSISGRGLATLKAQGFTQESIDSIHPIQGRRFVSGDSLLAEVEQLAPDPLSASQKQLILEVSNPVEPVTTDCLACHR